MWDNPPSNFYSFVFSFSMIQMKRRRWWLKVVVVSVKKLKPHPNTNNNLRYNPGERSLGKNGNGDAPRQVPFFNLWKSLTRVKSHEISRKSSDRVGILYLFALTGLEFCIFLLWQGQLFVILARFLQKSWEIFSILSLAGSIFQSPVARPRRSSSLVFSLIKIRRSLPYSNFVSIAHNEDLSMHESLVSTLISYSSKCRNFRSKQTVHWVWRIYHFLVIYSWTLRLFTPWTRVQPQFDPLDTKI